MTDVEDIEEFQDHVVAGMKLLTTLMQEGRTGNVYFNFDSGRQLLFGIQTLNLAEYERATGLIQIGINPAKVSATTTNRNQITFIESWKVESINFQYADLLPPA